MCNIHLPATVADDFLKHAYSIRKFFTFWTQTEVSFCTLLVITASLKCIVLFLNTFIINAHQLGINVEKKTIRCTSAGINRIQFKYDCCICKDKDQNS